LYGHQPVQYSGIHAHPNSFIVFLPASTKIFTTHSEGVLILHTAKFRILTHSYYCTSALITNKTQRKGIKTFADKQATPVGVQFSGRKGKNQR
jgi:hypothetical protein